uniref:Ankyrin repeat domain 18B n=1 Tax=Cebus imitator TaxID=2715852 RepID=A0A2K5Q3X2_CEBIM
MKFFGFGSRRAQVVRDSTDQVYTGSGYRIRDADLRKIHRAAVKGDAAEVERCLARRSRDLNARDKQRRTALHLACAHGHVEVVSLLVDRKCQIDVYRSQLFRHDAVHSQEETCASILLKHGANPNLKDSYGNTALHYAVYNDATSLAEKLLSHDADIEALDKVGNTPLLFAVICKKEKMVQFLVKRQANVHAVNRSALILAVHHGLPDTVNLLLQQNINIFSQDKYGRDATDYAISCDSTRIKNQIMEHKKKILEKDKPGKTSDLEFLISLNFLVDSEEEQERLERSEKKEPEDFHSHEKMKDPMHENGILKRDIAMLREEICTLKNDSLKKENKYFKDFEIIKEINARLEKSNKLSEEMITKILSQYRQQLKDLQAENTSLKSELGKEKEDEERLEAETESYQSGLAAAIREHNQRVEAERDLKLSLQRTQDISLQINMSSELKDEFLKEKLSKTQIKFNTLKDKLCKISDTLREKTLALETAQNQLRQTQQQIKEMKEMYQNADAKVSKSTGKRNYVEERICELQRKNLWLKQQLDDAYQKGDNEETIINIQGGFFESGKKCLLLEEKNKKLMNECSRLKERLFQHEKEKAVDVRQLQQQLADSLKNISTSELPLEGTSRCHINLDETQASKKKLFQVESQPEEEKKELRKRSELISSLKYNMDQIRKKNDELEKERAGYKKLLEMTKCLLNEFGNEELVFHGDLETDQLEMNITKLKHKFDDLTEELGAVSSKCLYLAKNNQVIQQELISMKDVQQKYEKLEEVNKTLEQEVVNLKTHKEKNMVDLSELEEYKLQIEERTRQERKKLEEIGLQKQAEYEKHLEQLKKNYMASVNKIDLIQKDAKYQFCKMKTAYEEATTELKEYKEAFAIALKANRSMSKKVKKSNKIITRVRSMLHMENRQTTPFLSPPPVRPDPGSPGVGNLNSMGLHRKYIPKKP